MDAIRLVVEIRQQQQQMKEHLLRMINHEGDAEAINAVFRAVHGIFCAAHYANGDDGASKYQFIIEFIKVLFDVLDAMRSEQIKADPALLQVLLACSEHLGALMGCVKNGTEPGDDINRAGHSLREKLQHLTLLPGV